MTGYVNKDEFKVVHLPGMMIHQLIHIGNNSSIIDNSLSPSNSLRLFHLLLTKEFTNPANFRHISLLFRITKSVRNWLNPRYNNIWRILNLYLMINLDLYNEKKLLFPFFNHRGHCRYFNSNICERVWFGMKEYFVKIWVHWYKRNQFIIV